MKGSKAKLITKHRYHGKSETLDCVIVSDIYQVTGTHQQDAHGARWSDTTSQGYVAVKLDYNKQVIYDVPLYCIDGTTNYDNFIKEYE
jgi:hypothetical protein